MHADAVLLERARVAYETRKAGHFFLTRRQWIGQAGQTVNDAGREECFIPIAYRLQRIALRKIDWLYARHVMTADRCRVAGRCAYFRPIRRKCNLRVSFDSVTARIRPQLAPAPYRRPR